MGNSEQGKERMKMGRDLYLYLSNYICIFITHSLFYSHLSFLALGSPFPSPRSLFLVLETHLQATCNTAWVALAVDRKVAIKARENAILACRESSFSSHLHAQWNYNWRSKKLLMTVSFLVGSFRKVLTIMFFSSDPPSMVSCILPWWYSREKTPIRQLASFRTHLLYSL